MKLLTANTKQSIKLRIDVFHGLNILLFPFIFALQASFFVTYSFGFKACERGLTGKLECKQKNIYRKKDLQFNKVSVKNGRFPDILWPTIKTFNRGEDFCNVINSVFICF